MKRTISTMPIAELRRTAGLTQYVCAEKAGISRFRLSLAETGQTSLTADEEAAVSKVIHAHIVSRTREVERLLHAG